MFIHLHRNVMQTVLGHVIMLMWCSVDHLEVKGSAADLHGQTVISFETQECSHLAVLSKAHALHTPCRCLWFELPQWELNPAPHAEWFTLLSAGSAQDRNLSQNQADTAVCDPTAATDQCEIQIVRSSLITLFTAVMVDVTLPTYDFILLQTCFCVAQLLICLSLPDAPAACSQWLASGTYPSLFLLSIVPTWCHFLSLFVFTSSASSSFGHCLSFWILCQAVWWPFTQPSLCLLLYFPFYFLNSSSFSVSCFRAGELSKISAVSSLSFAPDLKH